MTGQGPPLRATRKECILWEASKAAAAGVAAGRDRGNAMVYRYSVLMVIMMESHLFIYMTVNAAHHLVMVC